MSTICYTPWKIPIVRATKLNSCGLPVTGCSTVVSNGIISVEMTNEVEQRQEFFVKNGDGNFCVQATNAPILKWINLVITFCNVDPELLNIMTAEPLYMNDASSPISIGWSTEVGSAANANFALEGWTRLAPNASLPCTGGVEYGYGVLPWVVEGMVGDISWQNDTVNFVVNARTANNSPWGLGPYFVDYSDNPAGSTTPVRLLTPIGSQQHKRFFTTRLAPPTAACGCSTLSSLTPS